MRRPVVGSPGEAPLRRGEVHVWIVDTRFDGSRSTVTDLLSPGERARARRYRFRRDGERFERHRASLRSVLARYLEAPPADLAFDTNCLHCGNPTHGKPQLVGEPSGFSFSRSGAGEVTAIAVGTGMRVGVDVECHRAREIAAGALAAADTADLEGADARDREGALLWTWACKEAVLKVDGYGLAIDPRSLTLSTRSGRTGPKVLRAPVDHPSLLSYQLSDLPIAGGWGCGCVATDLPADRLKVFSTQVGALLGVE